MRSIAAFAAAAALLFAAACSASSTTSARRVAPTTTTAMPQPRYEATATVLEDATHGPQLCLGIVLQSDPPQCGGPDIVGWRWRDVAGRLHRGMTTWVDDIHVVGTYDRARDRFTLTEPPSYAPRDATQQRDVDLSPACARPVISDPHGRLWPPPEDTVPAGDRIATWVSSDPLVVNVVVRPGAGAAAEARIRTKYTGRLCVVERDGVTEAARPTIQRQIADARLGTPLGRVLGSWTSGRSGYITASVMYADRDAIAYAKRRWGNKVRLESALRPVSP